MRESTAKVYYHSTPSTRSQRPMQLRDGETQQSGAAAGKKKKKGRKNYIFLLATTIAWAENYRYM